MSRKMTLSFHSPVMEEHESKLMTGNLEERKLAFKSDEELMRETTKFVTEVIETAATEANRRKVQGQDGANSEGNLEQLHIGSRLKGGDIITGWNNRARGFCNRILNALCPCFTNTVDVQIVDAQTSV
ncbi:uncharacterized protein LOC135165612 isoform X2 [Diachasmimorpha longicaudata]|uniref:uncharacterized protein LOC135165612 isoform X2 n=1 Tax=Diachasmimorpha longicaudata TaxID=58733 RepID=UPI0030B8C244